MCYNIDENKLYDFYFNINIDLLFNGFGYFDKLYIIGGL